MTHHHQVCQKKYYSGDGYVAHVTKEHGGYVKPDEL